MYSRLRLYGYRLQAISRRPVPTPGSQSAADSTASTVSADDSTASTVSADDSCRRRPRGPTPSVSPDSVGLSSKPSPNSVRSPTPCSQHRPDSKDAPALPVLSPLISLGRIKVPSVPSRPPPDSTVLSSRPPDFIPTAPSHADGLLPTPQSSAVALPTSSRRLLVMPTAPPDSTVTPDGSQWLSVMPTASSRLHSDSRGHHPISPDWAWLPAGSWPTPTPCPRHSTDAFLPRPARTGPTTEASNDFILPPPRP